LIRYCDGTKTIEEILTHVASNVTGEGFDAMQSVSVLMANLGRDGILKFSDQIQDAVSKNVHIDDVINMKARENLARMKTVSNKQIDKKFLEIEKELDKEFNSLVKGGS